jgi:hypothetical protein
MKAIFFSCIMMSLGILSGCGTEYHSPRTVIIDKINDPLIELELVVGKQMVDQMRENQASIGLTTSYKHCIRNISTKKYTKLQEALTQKKSIAGIRGMTPVASCPLNPSAQCVKIGSADYYYSQSTQLLESLKQNCEIDGTWFAFTNKHLANTSVPYSGYGFLNGNQY